jgi:hypothetical protein
MGNNRFAGRALGIGAVVGIAILLLRPKSASAATRRGSSRDRPAEPLLPSPTVLSHSARKWAPLLAQLGPDVPLAASQAWIDQESSGNVCAIGNKPALGQKYPQEYGLSQLDVNDPTNVAIMSQSNARSPCQNSGASRGDWEVQLRPLTDAERAMHAKAALDHMRAARAHAHEQTVGWGWDINGTETWKLAKLYHAGPAYVRLARVVAKALGRPPHDFVEFQVHANGAGLQAGLTQMQLTRAWDNVAGFAKRMLPAWGRNA